MNTQFWSGLLGAVVGALSAILSAWIAASRQDRSEYRKWLRDQRRQAYLNAIGAVSKAMMIPVGSSTDALKLWSGDLTLVRNTLTILLAYQPSGDARLSQAAEQLAIVLEEWDFAALAGEAAAIQKAVPESAGFVLLSVREIRNALTETLTALNQSSTDFLGPDARKAL